MTNKKTSELPVAKSITDASFAGFQGTTTKTTKQFPSTLIAGMQVAIYDPAGIDEQVVGETATQTLTNKTLSNPVITGTATGLAIGVDVQAWDADLDAISGLANTDGNFIVGTGATWTVESGATARTSLGLTIGTDVQAQNARLADIAGITYAQGDILYHNGSNIVNLGPGTSGNFLRTNGAGADPSWVSIPGGGDLLSTNNLNDVANAGTSRTNLGLAIGSDVQAFDAGLDSIAGLTTAADRMIYTTASDTYAVSTLTSAGRAILDDASASAQRTTMGVAIGSDVQAYDAVLDNPTGQQTIWIPAGAMTSRTTSGAASGSAETTTNKIMLKTLDFDSSTDEFAQFGIQMPKSWNEGTLVCQPVWSHPSTATNFGVAWFVQAVAFADGDAADTAFGTAVSSVDTGGTTDDIYIGPETSALTVAGTPGAEEYLIFQVYRDVSDAGDTLAVDARLHGVKIHYTNDALRDD